MPSTSRRTAPAGLEPLARFGQDVCVVWDVEDAASDLVLSAGLSVARALCVRRHHERTSQAVSFAEIDELKNLLVMHLTDTGTWDWNRALEQFAVNREGFRAQHRRQVGFSFAAARNGVCDDD